MWTEYLVLAEYSTLYRFFSLYILIFVISREYYTSSITFASFSTFSVSKWIEHSGINFVWNGIISLILFSTWNGIILNDVVSAGVSFYDTAALKYCGMLMAFIVSFYVLFEICLFFLLTWITWYWKADWAELGVFRMQMIDILLNLSFWKYYWN